MAPSSCLSLRGSAVTRWALLASICLMVITATLEGTSGRSIPSSSTSRRPGEQLTSQVASRMLQEGDSDGDSGEAASEDTGNGRRPSGGKSASNEADSAADEGGVGDSDDQEGADSRKLPILARQKVDAEVAAVGEDADPAAALGKKKKRTSQVAEDSDNPDSEGEAKSEGGGLEIVGRGDDETPADVPPELIPVDEKEVKDILAGREASAEGADETAAGEAEVAGFKKNKKKKFVAAEEGQEGEPQGSEADSAMTDGSDGASDAPLRKKKKNRAEEPVEGELSDASQTEDGEQEDVKEESRPLRKRSADVSEDAKATRERQEEGVDVDGGEVQAPDREDAEGAGDEGDGRRPATKKLPRTEEAEDGQKFGLERPSGSRKGGSEGVPETIEAREREDSGNSGVADEITLGDSATKAEVENFGGDVPETRVPLVGAPEAYALEEAALDDEEDYASFMSELYSAGQRISPAMQGLKEKTEKHVVPTVQELATRSHAAFMTTSDRIRDHVTPILGPSFSPVVATLMSISLLLLPLVLIGVLVYQIRFILTLQRLLVLCNLYLFLYCFALLAACVIMSAEPMRSLLRAAEPNFFVLQAFVVLGYLVYLSLQFWWLVIVVRAKGRERDPILISKAAFMCAVAVGIALHYYVFVFERALLDKPPRITAWGYLVYSLLFLLLTFVGRPRDTQEDVGKDT